MVGLARVSLALFLAGSAACTGAGDEPDYGVGGKADDLCDPAGDLCWTTADLATMKRVLQAQDDFALGRQAQRALLDATGALEALDHKLDDGEAVALRALGAEAASRPADATTEELAQLYGRLRQGALDRVSGTYYATLAVQAGQAAQSELDGKSDDTGAASHGRADQGLTLGMRQSLEQLRSSGVMGRGYATMLEASGVLDKDYVVLNAQNFGELDPATGRIVLRGLSREERVSRIIAEYERAAGFVGVAAGAESLIPVAGIAISISHETYELFRLHAQMTFEIAAVYGWDLREGRNLYTITMMLLSEGLIAEVGDVLASNIAVPMIAKIAARRLGISLPADLAAQLASRALPRLLEFFTKKSQQELAEAALTKGAKGVASQLLGWATLGLAVFASGAADYVITGLVGEHVAMIAQRQVEELMLEGSTHLSKPAARDCMFRALGAMAGADGSVTEREERLIMAMLAKSYRITTGAGQWFTLSREEMVRQSAAVRAASDSGIGEARACLVSHVGGAQPQYRLTTLGHLYAMMQVDLQESSTERAFYSGVTADLGGAGLLGARVSDYLGYLERGIDLVLQPGKLEAPVSITSALKGILPEDVLPFLAQPTGDAASAFACGFGGDC